MNNSLSERISFVVDNSKLSKTKFAEKINISQPYLSQLCTGVKKPSDRTVTDICREFDVSETWLRTGEGEPFIQLSRDAQITRFVGEAMRGESPSDQQRFLNAMLGATPEELQAIARFAKRLAAEYAEELAKEKKGNQ